VKKPIFERSKSANEMTVGIEKKESPQVLTPKHLVQIGLECLSQEGVEVFTEYF
jgi:hypothetical protein